MDPEVQVGGDNLTVEHPTFSRGKLISNYIIKTEI